MNKTEVQKIAARKLQFRLHSIVYFAVSVIMVIANVATYDGYFWVFYPVTVWSVLLALHWLLVNGPAVRLPPNKIEDIEAEEETKKKK